MDHKLLIIHMTFPESAVNSKHHQKTANLQ